MQSALKAEIESIKIDRDSARIVLLGVPDMPGVAERVFSALAERGVGVEMIVQNNSRGGVTDIGFLVKKECLDPVIEVCKNAAQAVDAQGVSFNTEIARVTVAADALSEDFALPAKIFKALADAKVNIDMIASSECAITCVVAAGDVEKAKAALQKSLLGGCSE